MGPRTQLGSWVFLGAGERASLPRMKRQSILLLALAAAFVAPASASAAPTVTVTGDGGQPTPLSATAPLGLRNMDITVTVAVPATDAGNYTAQVFGPDGVAVSPVSFCADPEFTTSTRGFPDYRGNGAYTVVLRYFAEADDSLRRHGERAAVPVRRQWQQRRHAAAHEGAHARTQLVRHQPLQLRLRSEPRRVDLRDPVRARWRRRPRRRDLRPLERGVRPSQLRARRVPLRQAGRIHRRRPRRSQQLLHPVERPGDRHRDRAVRPRARHVPRRRAARGTSCAARCARRPPAAAA